MPLSEEFRAQGNWLFRHRSRLPLLTLVLLAPVAWEVSAGRYEYRTRWWWQIGCVTLAAAGLIVRVLTVGFAAPGTSGRNTRGQRAADINTTGFYATVRHPLYLGNFLIFLALLLFTGAWWLVVCGSLVYWFYYERIMFAEEEFLRETYGERFVMWASSTPAAVPRLRNWRRPHRSFSVRKALRGEYPTLFGTTASFAFVDTLLRSSYRRLPAFNSVWIAAFSATLLFYLGVRAICKLSRALDGE